MSDASDEKALKKLEKSLTKIESPINAYVLSKVQLGSIKELSINGTNCGFRLLDEDVAHLCGSLFDSHCNLQTLSLRNHRITEVGLAAIEALTSSTVISLDLESNDITHVVALNLADGKRCKLRSLNISCNPLGEAGGLELADSMAKNPSILHLSANNCNFNLNALVGVIASLQRNIQLRTLQIDRPLLQLANEEEGTSHVCRVLLNKDAGLEMLSMRNHGVNDFGARILSDALSRNFVVTELNLESNRINAAGAEALASYLIIQSRQRMSAAAPRSASYLKKLFLSYNAMGDEGAIAFAEALKVNYSLEVLSLKSNGVGARGLNALADALDSAPALRSLKVFGNDFDQTAGKAFYDLIKHRFPSAGLSIDIAVYIVDRVYQIAEA